MIKFGTKFAIPLSFLSPIANRKTDFLYRLCSYIDISYEEFSSIKFEFPVFNLMLEVIFHLTNVRLYQKETSAIDKLRNHPKIKLRR